MWAALGMLAALHERERTGEGSEVDVSLYETALAFMAYHLTGYLGARESCPGGRAPASRRSRRTRSFADGGRRADGRGRERPPVRRRSSRRWACPSSPPTRGSRRTRRASRTAMQLDPAPRRSLRRRRARTRGSRGSRRRACRPRPSRTRRRSPRPSRPRRSASSRSPQPRPACASRRSPLSARRRAARPPRTASRAWRRHRGDPRRGRLLASPRSTTSRRTGIVRLAS